MLLYQDVTVASAIESRFTTRAFSQGGSPPARLLNLGAPNTVIDWAGETPEKDPEQDPLRTDVWNDDKGEADQKKDPKFFNPLKTMV